MATFPEGIYTHRTVENRPGVTFDASKSKVLFAEDISSLADEINAIEEVIGTGGDPETATIEERLAALEATPAPQFPTGATVQWWTATPPDGWLICNGQAVSRTTYADLFALWGVFFGNGDGSTTFNLPDTRRRVIRGHDTSSTSYDAFGETGGEEKHTLLVGEMAEHNHDFYGQTFSWGANIGNVYAAINAQGGATPPNTNYLYTQQNAAGWAYTANRGSNTPFNVTGKYIVGAYIVKT